MGYAEQFEQWLDADLEALQRCAPDDRETVEGIVMAWAHRPARALVARAFFANWQTAVERWDVSSEEGAQARARLALRLDEKYRRLRDQCEARMGRPCGLPPSILAARGFWEETKRAPGPLGRPLAGQSVLQRRRR